MEHIPTPGITLTLDRIPVKDPLKLGVIIPWTQARVENALKPDAFIPRLGARIERELEPGAALPTTTAKVVDAVRPASSVPFIKTQATSAVRLGRSLPWGSISHVNPLKLASLLPLHRNQAEADVPAETDEQVEAPAEPQLIMAKQHNPILRGLWFATAGWWLTFWAISLTTLLQLSVVGIPAAIWLTAKIPSIATLKSTNTLRVEHADDGTVTLHKANTPQLPTWVRAAHDTLIGWWASLLWMYAAFFMTLTLAGIPVSLWMYARTARVQTLRR